MGQAMAKQQSQNLSVRSNNSSAVERLLLLLARAIAKEHLRRVAKADDHSQN